MTEPGAIDCDVHPTVPSIGRCCPISTTFWRDSVVERGIEFARSPSAIRRTSPLTRGRNGAARAAAPRPTPSELARAGVRPLAGRAPRSSIASTASNSCSARTWRRPSARALNDWIAKEWLDRDPRLRASIVVPMQNTEFAVDEIERCAKDRRFVQVLVLAMQEMPLGRRHFWPIYAAAERHGLPIGIHAGSAYRHPVTSLGWPTYYVEDYAAQAQGFQSQLASLITEGVFAKFPELKVVLIESGVTWLPAFLWRFGKFWRGLRTEVPWVDRPPARDRARPCPPDDSAVRCARTTPTWSNGPSTICVPMIYCSTRRTIRIGSSTATNALPPGLPAALRRKILVDNPLATYVAAEGGRAMNIEVRATGALAARRKLDDRRLRLPSARSRSSRPAAVSEQSLVGAICRPTACARATARQGLRLSEGDAAGGAPRRLAAGRRAAGERSRFHAAAASRFLRHRLRAS